MSSGGGGGKQNPADPNLPNPAGTGGIDPTRTFGPLQGGPRIQQMTDGDGLQAALARSNQNMYEPSSADKPPDLGLEYDQGEM